MNCKNEKQKERERGISPLSPFRSFLQILSLPPLPRGPIKSQKFLPLFFDPPSKIKKKKKNHHTFEIEEGD